MAPKGGKEKKRPSRHTEAERAAIRQRKDALLAEKASKPGALEFDDPDKWGLYVFPLKNAAQLAGVSEQVMKPFWEGARELIDAARDVDEVLPLMIKDAKVMPHGMTHGARPSNPLLRRSPLPLCPSHGGVPRGTTPATT